MCADGFVETLPLLGGASVREEGVEVAGHPGVDNVGDVVVALAST